MKISEGWLREWVDPDMSTNELVHTLTMAGLEVDAVSAAAPEFSGVVVGQIETVEPHPDAEKLRVCSVTDGLSNFQVVCGAPNAAAGMKIPFAKVGAELPAPGEGGEGKESGDALKIKKAKLRGVESFGMLCGGSELGLDDVVDGLLELPADAPVGDDFRDYLKLEDSVIEVDLTPNRGDCLSVLGVAREVGVLAKSKLSPPKMPQVPASIDDTVGVVLEAPDYCPRYAGRVVRNIDNTVESPLWLREKLRRAGLRSIDAVVDITNYVLLELGQPMHAFDLDKLSGDIVVRRAAANEKIALLDGSELESPEGFLFIADQKQPLALAGIMGGASSAVSRETKNILFESAFFAPEQHAGKARQVGMHTDSSHRFERGVDRAGQARAIERATELLLELCGGEAGPLNVVESKASAALGESNSVELRAAQIKRVLGFEIPAEQVEDMFIRLDFKPEKTAKGWRVAVPSHRFDIALEADLLEELARVYGYDNVPVEPPLAPMDFALKPEKKLTARKFRDTLVARGYREVITYSFIDPEVHRQFFDSAETVALTNPIASDMAVMRSSLLPGLVKAAGYNLSRQQRRMQLFEQGLRFVKRGDAIDQRGTVAGLLCGERLPESWLSKPESVKASGQHADSFDFYDLKGDVEALLAHIGGALNDSIEFHTLNDGDGYPCLHPGQAAAVCVGNRRVGVLGALHPKLHKALDLDTDIWLFELDSLLISDKKVPEFKELSKFPEVRRDLAIIVDEAISVGDVLAAAKQAAASELKDLVVFDRYCGEGVGAGKQSIGLGLTWQHPERTLQDEEVATLTNSVVAALQEQFQAQLR